MAGDGVGVAAGAHAASTSNMANRHNPIDEAFLIPCSPFSLLCILATLLSKVPLESGRLVDFDFYTSVHSSRHWVKVHGKKRVDVGAFAFGYRFASGQRPEMA